MKKYVIWSVLLYLRFFARLALRLNKVSIIAITGSVGKSSARSAVYAVLKDSYPVYCIEEGNSETGIPLGILGMTPKDYSLRDWWRMLRKVPFSLSFLKNYDYVIVEMGIDEPDPPKNMGFLLTILQPEIAIFLNVYPVHSMQFDKTVPRSMQGEGRMFEIQKNIAKEKGKIITASSFSTAIYNADNIFVSDVVESFKKDHKEKEILAFGVDKRNYITYAGYELQGGTSVFTFIDYSNEKLRVEIPGYLLPEEYREIFAAALAVGRSMGKDNIVLKKGLEKNFHLPPGRMSVLKGMRGATIIDSSYNASKASVSAALRMASMLAKKEKKPLIFLFGDMRELGDEAQHEHEFVASEICSAVDELYCVGPLTFNYVMPKVEDKLKKTKWFHSSEGAGTYILEHMPDNAIVLVKGSQNEIFLEEAIKKLLADPADSAKLCRQDAFWIQTKASYFKIRRAD
ncbi:MAG: hypothetical protein RI947_189 [Candidatus Parcubacteria bacterium]|jgi:UDP-N-acetylmuramoyl-tripeptide--D-alanyl-D-alanine ligase